MGDRTGDKLVKSLPHDLHFHFAHMWEDAPLALPDLFDTLAAEFALVLIVG